jgi:hypothetical protein
MPARIPSTEVVPAAIRATSGYSVDGINGLWYGSLTTAAGADIHWGTDQLGQVGASSEGSFGLTGDFNFDGACFNSGKLAPGSFPTPSFILGYVRGA